MLSCLAWPPSRCPGAPVSIPRKSLRSLHQEPRVREALSPSSPCPPPSFLPLVFATQPLPSRHCSSGSGILVKKATRLPALREPDIYCGDRYSAGSRAAKHTGQIVTLATQEMHRPRVMAGSPQGCRNQGASTARPADSGLGGCSDGAIRLPEKMAPGLQEEAPFIKRLLCAHAVPRISGAPPTR